MKVDKKQIRKIDPSSVIRMAWEDRCSFEVIEERTGLNEAAVIAIMRRALKPSSFRLWRKRVSGRATKHLKAFRKRRAELRPNRSRKFSGQGP